MKNELNKIYENAGMKLEEILYVENPFQNFTDNVYDNFGIYKYISFNDSKLDEPSFIVAHALKKSEDNNEVSWSWGHYDFSSINSAMNYLDDYLKTNQDISLSELLKVNNINSENIKENPVMENKENNFGNIYSFSPFGYEGAIIAIETDLRRGIPAVDIVGLVDSSVKESRERMMAAIRNTGFDFPSERVLISLSPADIRKEGAGFDLPIALSVLNEQNKKTNNNGIPENVLVMGELELNGSVRPVKGVRAAVDSAKSLGITNFILPEQNLYEVKNIEGIKVLGVNTLLQAYEKSQNMENFNEIKNVENNNKNEFFNEELINDFKDTIKDSSLQTRDYDRLRAIAIAVSGKHNMMSIGSPGCGKTMDIQGLVPLLTPKLTEAESLSVNRLYSLAGLTKPNEDNLTRPAPFRMPHQSASIEGICGGGPNCNPGEISLAHNGTLFLDETTEFRSSVLQMLRVPLESKHITLSRAGRTTVYPANFQLMAATNPCPCGNLGSHDRICLCSAKSVEQYWKKVGAPLMDRIDIFKSYNSNVSDNSNANEKKHDLTFSDMQKWVKNAFEIQRERGAYNGKLRPEEISEYCHIDKKTQEFLNKKTEKYGYSPRRVNSILKLSLTIANMDGRKNIELNDLKEAESLARIPLDESYIYQNKETMSDYYKPEPKTKEFESVKSQKEFLEKTSEKFEKDVNQIIEKNNSDSLKKENQISKNISEEEKEKILQNVKENTEELKRQNVNINVNSKIHKR